MSNIAQRSFAIGEVSPKLHARADLNRYREALRALRNAIVTKEGGAQSRPGTVYCGAAKGASGLLIPCVFAAAQAYVLEFGNLYVRFWLEGVQVTVSGVAAWADVTPYVVGDVKSYLGVNYYCWTAHTSATADNRPSTGTTWATKWTALTGAILEVPTPYTTADLSALSVAHADATTMFVAHPSYPMRELVRTAATTWTFALTVYSAADAVTAPTNLVATGAVGSAAGPPYYTAYQVTAFIGTLESPVSNTDGWNKRPFPASLGNKTPITLTWDAVAGATSYRVYRSYSNASYRTVASVTTTTFLDEGSVGTARTAPTEVNAVTDFTVAGQYPGVISTYQQRLIVAGQTTYPDFIYASRTGSFRNFFPHFPLQDDDALSWRQVGARLNRITNLAEVAQRLVAWSEVSEGVVSGDEDGILRPGEVNPRTMSYNGATATMDPLLLNDTALYVQARGGIVRDLRPQDGVGSDLSATASHLVSGYTLTDNAFQQTPHSVAWLVRSDGALLSLTYSRETGVFAWARHDTGIADTFLSLACVPEGARDVVYALVVRTGGTYMEKWSDRDDLVNLPVAMDSAKVTTNPAAATMVLATAGRLAAYSATPQAGIYDAFNAADWAAGADATINAASGSLVVTSTTFPGMARNTALASRSQWFVQALMSLGAGDPAGGGLIGPAARIEDVAGAADYVWALEPSGTIANTLYGDRIEWIDNGASQISSAGTPPTAAERPMGGLSLTNLSTETARADAYFTNAGETRGIVTFGIAGTGRAGFHYVGTVFTTTVLAWVATTGRYLVVNGPTRAFRAEVLDSGGTVLASAVAVAGVASVSLLAIDMPATAVRIINTADASTLLTETPAGGVWAGDIWTLTWNSTYSGLSHLEGETVSVTANGVVYASPNNPAYTAVTVASGAVTLDSETYTRVVVGLPITVDLETLDIDRAGSSMKDAGINVKKVGLWLEESMTPFVAQSLPASDTSTTGMQQMPMLDEEENVTTDPISGYRNVNIDGAWTNRGRIALRHVDPTPLAVLAIVASGDFGRG